MGLKYLHCCANCQEMFDDEVNSGKDSLCPHCTMLPEVADKHYHMDCPAGITPGGTRMIRTKGEDHDDSVETIDSGMTGQHVLGTANLLANKPHKSHVFKRKPCKKCKKIFEPAGPAQKFCPDCRPLTVIATRQAKKFEAELKGGPRKGRGRHVNKVSRVALEKLADGLLTEPSGRPQNRMPQDHTTGLNMFIKQETVAPLPGYWAKDSSGTTADRRQYVISKEVLTSDVVIDLWGPRERYFSADRIHRTSLAQGNDCCGCTPPPVVPEVQ